MQRFLAYSTVAGLALLPSIAGASERGSMEDQLACTPDVYRLCTQYIPNEDAIVACLQKNMSGLSAACHRVFANPPSAGKSNDEDD